MKKVISLFLVFSILLLSGNLFAKERKGADLIIQKKDGQQVRGELIAVKQNSLLLLERDSGADVSVDIGDIRVITIVKKSKFLKGAGIGALAGAGFITGLALIGGFVGLAAGNDEIISIYRRSDTQIQEILDKLRKKARVRNSQ